MSKTNLLGIDKWLIDLSFIKDFWNKSINIIKNNKCALFLQTRIFLEKFYTEAKITFNNPNYDPLNSKLIEFLEKNFDNYISNNIFLYDEEVLKKCIVKNFNENSEFKNAIVVHPTIFVINLSILLYFKKNAIKPDNPNIFSRINFSSDSYGDIFIDFSKNNFELFNNKKNELAKKFTKYIKVNIRNFYDSITESVLRKFVNKKFNLDSNNLEMIINYTKHICNNNNNHVVPTHEFSPLYAYIATSCVLEGIINDALKSYILKNPKKDINILCYVDDIYIFSNKFEECVQFKNVLSDELLLNSLEINELKSEHNKEQIINNTNINTILFIQKLVDELEKNDECINYLDKFKKVMEENHISNPFHYILNSEPKKVENLECDELSKIINNVSSEIYFKMIDINPKYFILLLKKYNNTSDRTKYPLKKLINKFSEYKNDKKLTINESYYIYYYINFSFIGLYKNIISDLSFPKISSLYNINFQKFIKGVFENYPKENAYKIIQTRLGDFPIKKIMSLLFFLKNQFLEDKYNDCVLIISALYDLIKNTNKNNKFYFNEAKCLCCGKNSNDYLKSKNIDPLNYGDWNHVYKLRCNLSSCHLKNETEINNGLYTIKKIKKLLSNVMNWINKKKEIDIFNNYLKLLILLKNI